MKQFAVLVVEDTPDIQGTYQRAVERQGGSPIIVASFDDAVQAIRKQAFPVAIVDVRLSEEDETNVDGLRVLEFIRSTKDITKAIVITGYGSFQIAREAFRQYDVFEGHEKGVDLSVIETTIRRARESFLQQSATTKLSYTEILKGPTGPLWDWDDQVLRMTKPKGGADGLYRFLEGLLQGLSPFLYEREFAGCLISAPAKLVAGKFWSRGLGAAVLVAFGPKDDTVTYEAGALSLKIKELFGALPQLGGVLREMDSHGLRGVVYALKNEELSSYDLSRLKK